MIILYAHALIFPMFRVIGSCIMKYISLVSLLPIYGMFLFQVLLCTCCFVDLTLLVLFFSVFKKFKNP